MVEAKTAADYVLNMTTLARQGYDLVIGVGFAQGDAIAAAAKKFPDTNFAIVDVDQSFLKGKPKNVQGLLFREEQVGYLVGYLGALEAEKSGSKSISAVGASRSRRSTASSPATRPAPRRPSGDEGRVVVLAGLGGPGEVQGARAQPDRRWLEVVFQVAGGCGLGALSAAKDEGVWGSASTATSRSSGPRPDERAQGRRQRGVPR